jgi:hypothetical protein
LHGQAACIYILHHSLNEQLLQFVFIEALSPAPASPPLRATRAATPRLAPAPPPSSPLPCRRRRGLPESARSPGRMAAGSFRLCALPFGRKGGTSESAGRSRRRRRGSPDPVAQGVDPSFPSRIYGGHGCCGRRRPGLSAAAVKCDSGATLAKGGGECGRPMSPPPGRAERRRGGVAPPLARCRGGAAATGPVARDAAPWWRASMAQQQVVGACGSGVCWPPRRSFVAYGSGRPRGGCVWRWPAGWLAQQGRRRWRRQGDGRAVEFRQRSVKRATEASFGHGCRGGVAGAARRACAVRVVAPGESLVAAASSDVALPVGGAILELHPCCARSLGENLVLMDERRRRHWCRPLLGGVDS